MQSINNNTNTIRLFGLAAFAAFAVILTPGVYEQNTKLLPQARNLAFNLETGLAIDSLLRFSDKGDADQWFVKQYATGVKSPKDIASVPAEYVGTDIYGVSLIHPSKDKQCVAVQARNVVNLFGNEFTLAEINVPFVCASIPTEPQKFSAWAGGAHYKNG